MAKIKKKVEPTSESGSSTKPVFYAVLRLNESVEVRNYRNEPCHIQVANEEVAGYIPVYKSVEAARKHSEDGKYPIAAITAT